jgi:hypothetical protein
MVNFHLDCIGIDSCSLLVVMSILMLFFLKSCIYAHMATAIYQAVGTFGHIVLHGLSNKVILSKLLVGSVLLVLFSLLILGFYL